MKDLRVKRPESQISKAKLAASQSLAAKTFDNTPKN